MTGIKIAVADDDEGIRLLLRKLIEKTEGFELAGEAGDGETLLRLVESVRPQVVFLDIEMPNIKGVECARRIADIDPKIIVIFATAFEEYMPEAFEVYAFDYITKPFKIERIIKTLDRIKKLNTFIEDEYTIKSPPSPKNNLRKLIVRGREEISLVDMDEIILIQREERSTVIYTAYNRYVTSDTLGELEDRLDKNIFFRSHKSYIINLSAVHKIYPYGRWTYLIKLKDTDKDALLTHDRYEELQNLFK